MKTVEDRLRDAVRGAMPRLLAIDDARASRRPAPGKWSVKEVIGHLVDSASNNHQRFVRALFTQDLVFPGYEQDAWVSSQRYADAPWNEVAGLFFAFNLHLARVIAAMPPEERTRPRARHNLHQIASKPVPETEPATLEYFMADYVDHLEHHLRQAFAAAGDDLPKPKPKPALRSAAPTFAVADVGATLRWYEERLGFEPHPFPDREPYFFAVLARDGVEIMLMRVEGFVRPETEKRRPAGFWDAYLRVRAVGDLFEALREKVPIRSPLKQRPYGDTEFEVTDPNGYILVFSEATSKTA